MNISISVVVTALNEKQNIIECLSLLHKTLSQNASVFEIIFVDDGSTDGTFEEASRLNYPELRMIRIPQNKGTGFAVKEALKVARYEWYCWLPSDLEIHPSELAGPLTRCETNDIVITYFENGREVRTLLRQILSQTFLAIVNFTFSRKLKYVNGVSLIRRRLIEPEKISSNGFFFHAELLLRTLVKTDRFAEVAIGLSKRKSGKQKALKLNVLIDVMICYTRIVWQTRQGR